MNTVARAILFDLDDTLYPRRRFVLSGFRRVAAHLNRALGLDPHQVRADAVVLALAEVMAVPAALVPDERRRHVA